MIAIFLPETLNSLFLIHSIYYKLYTLHRLLCCMSSKQNMAYLVLVVNSEWKSNYNTLYRLCVRVMVFMCTCVHVYIHACVYTGISPFNISCIECCRH